MAKDPICGMFVEENSNSIHYSKNGIGYYFCASQCLNEFVQPEKELKRLKNHVAISIALTIPILILSLPHMIPQLESIYPKEIMKYASYAMLILAIPIQFWIGLRFYRGLWDGLKAKSSNMDTLIAIGTSTAFTYSAIVTLIPQYFPYTSVYFETSSIIITLILIGRLLEIKTKDNATSAVRALLDLKPSKARILRHLINIQNISKSKINNKDNNNNNNNNDVNLNSNLDLDPKILPQYEEIEIPIEQIQNGDIMLIRPGERVPTDGIIIRRKFVI